MESLHSGLVKKKEKKNNLIQKKSHKSFICCFPLKCFHFLSFGFFFHFLHLELAMIGLKLTACVHKKGI